MGGKESTSGPGAGQRGGGGKKEETTGWPCFGRVEQVEILADGSGQSRAGGVAL